MAGAGMLHRGGKNGADGGDDVQRSLELLDKVLSEFDEGEPRSLDSVVAPPESAVLATASAASAARSAASPARTPASPARTPASAAHTPDDDSPSLAGHQSEDDGYMSMNGRRAKFALGFRPTDEREESASGDSPPSPPRSALAALAAPAAPAAPAALAMPASPPPPEEAQRIISTLLPKVSPANSAKRNISKLEAQRPPETEPNDSIVTVNGVPAATQTTLPKTRHQRPYGWDRACDASNAAFQLEPPPAAPCRFASLPYGARPPPSSHAGAARGAPLAPLAPPPPPLAALACDRDKPYNEHPVTIYPGPAPAHAYTKLHSPTFVLQRVPPFNPKPSHHAPDNRKTIKPDERIDAALSPKSKIPPRTLAGSMERHREVCRGSSEDTVGDSRAKRLSKNNDEDHFSDDSLEESFPPPPPAVITPSKRNSIAWEVSLDDVTSLTPGSTKVIGRRRRRSVDTSHSSSGSIPQRLEEGEWATEEFWPPPPPPAACSSPLASAGTDSDPESDTRLPPDLNSTGTYVIRKGKNRKQLPNFAKTSSKPVKSNNLNRYGLNRSLDADKYIEEPGRGSGLSASHNSVSSGRPGSEPSFTHARYATDRHSRLIRELHTPNSRYSIDLCTPTARLAKEITSPKSRLSLDLNNGQDRRIALEYLSHSPKSFRSNGNDNSVPYAAKNVPNKLSPQNKFTDFKKYSSTFDNIKSLLREGKIEDGIGCELETADELPATGAPGVVRVVSLPSLANDKDGGGGGSGGSGGASRAALITTVEEEEDQEGAELISSGDASPLRKIEKNINAILSQGRDQKLFTPYVPKDWNIHRDEYCDDISNDTLDKNVRYSSRERQKRHDIQKSSSHNEIGSGRGSARRAGGVHKSTSAKEMARQPSSSDSAASSSGDFPVNVQIVEHAYRHAPPPLPPSPRAALELGPLPQTPESPAFPPLPPSPVQEVDDEYSEILQPRDKHYTRADTLPAAPDLRHRCSDPPAVPPHRDCTNSLKTRSMEAGYSKNKRSTNFKSGSTDRRTLPTDMAASGVRRRTLQRQSREVTPPGVRSLAPLQTSASLPETPIFARGCDVPRTPLRHTAATGLGPRQSNTMNSIQTIGGSSTLGGYGRGSVVGAGAGSGVERALAGAELLRLAGGPARGWYPRQRHRPASTEHLDRLTASSKAGVDRAVGGGGGAGGGWDGTASRKPLTLPPNLTPKFFQKSPREALRRVTSLLIRKGASGKEKEASRGREAVSPAARSVHAGEDHPGQKQRKGFFKSLWKRSRHYSLEQP